MEDDLKTLKVQYLSNHLLDHTQISNLSFDDQTIICMGPCMLDKPEMIFFEKVTVQSSGNSEPLQIHCLRFFEIKTSTIIRRYEYLVSLVNIYLIFVRWILQIYIWGIFHTGLVDIWQSFCIYSIIRH